MPGFAPVQKAPAAAPARTDKKRAGAVQPKLSVNRPGDRFEKEAEHTADRIMRASAGNPAPSISTLGTVAQRAADTASAGVSKGRDDKEVQRASAPEPKRDNKKAAGQLQRAASGARTLDAHTRELARDHEHDPRIQRKAKESENGSAKQPPAIQRDGPGGGDPPATFDITLSRAQQSGGNPLSPAVMQRMESGFGRSFGDVRVHADGAADTAAREIDARAFTLGRNIYFAQGQYQPHSQSGQHLLAHELTHVVQQSGRKANPQLAQRAAIPAARQADKKSGVSNIFEPKTTASDERRIVREKDTETGKAGTLVLNELSLPYFSPPKGTPEPKGANDHSEPSMRGQPADGKRPVRKDSRPAFTLLGKGKRSGSARKKFITEAGRDAAITGGIKTALTDTYKETLKPLPLGGPGDSVYALLPKSGTQPFVMIGKASDIASNEFALVPVWNDAGKDAGYEVDHLHEIQLGGRDGLVNFWHLDAETNRACGGAIDREVNNKITQLIEQAPPAFWNGNKPNVQELRETWRIDFLKIVKMGGIPEKPDYWTRQQLADGLHLKALRSLTEKEAVDRGLRLENGELNRLVIFATEKGGFYASLNRENGQWVPSEEAPGHLGVHVGHKTSGQHDPRQIFKGLGDTSIKIEKAITGVKDGEKIGEIKGTAFYVASGGKEKFDFTDDITLPLLQKRSLGFGVYVDRKPLFRKLNILFRKASPVTIDDAGISPAGELYVQGNINTTTPLFPNLDIPFAIVGETVRVDFPLPAEKLRLGPAQATWAGISIGVGPQTLELDGALGFAVRGLGSGYLEASISKGGKKAPAGAKPAEAGAKTEMPPESSTSFSLGGAFHFDMEQLDPASIEAKYENNKFSAKGDVGIKSGVIPGIADALIHVTHDDQGTTIKGSATLSVAGLQGTELQVGRDRDNNIEIGADNIQLPAGKMPGVRSGVASIHALRDSKGEWSVRGSGTVQAGIPGIDGQLGIDIDGELLTVSGTASVARGIMTGHAELLVTNRPRKEDGRPTEGRYPEVQPVQLSLTGKGDVSLQLGRLLTGTVGIEILPSEEIRLRGTVALPPTVDVFPQKSFDRVLFSPPPIDIPLVGVAAAGHRVGIFATIGGDLHFKASLGPGQLRDTALTVDYNPSHPEAASVHGDATFDVPAEAGLRLAVHGAVGAGAAVIDLTGGVEVGAQLGVKADASAHVGVDWTPAAGVSLAATAHISAEPQFTFDVTAYVKVAVEALTSIELYSHHWNLAEFKYGPALTFGVDLPVGWSEQTGLDFDPGKVEVHRPEINIKETLTGLFEKMVH